MAGAREGGAGRCGRRWAAGGGPRRRVRRGPRPTGSWRGFPGPPSRQGHRLPRPDRACRGGRHGGRPPAAGSSSLVNPKDHATRERHPEIVGGGFRACPVEPAQQSPRQALVAGRTSSTRCPVARRLGPPFPGALALARERREGGAAARIHPALDEVNSKWTRRAWRSARTPGQVGPRWCGWGRGRVAPGGACRESSTWR